MCLSKYTYLKIIFENTSTYILSKNTFTHILPRENNIMLWLYIMAYELFNAIIYIYIYIYI